MGSSQQCQSIWKQEHAPPVNCAVLYSVVALCAHRSARASPLSEGAVQCATHSFVPSYGRQHTSISMAARSALYSSCFGRSHTSYTLQQSFGGAPPFPVDTTCCRRSVLAAEFYSSCTGYINVRYSTVVSTSTALHVGCSITT